MTDITIQNCWRKIRILSDASEVEIEFEYQESENNLDDDEVAEIITDLSLSDNPEVSKIVQAIERYIQTIDEPITTEGLLNNEEIITIESDDNEEPSPSPVTTKVFYATKSRQIQNLALILKN
ncbi:17157_t:CDS:2 [Racocetra fulgida]|uniref:17157_t:CDS:1 n=1 Tax=Racocetra fulgida TaxID=60492 RepID=A0A9N9CSH0_9GLOM|nr:17157_t:CDS:2 [Racocetra fulgida]